MPTITSTDNQHLKQIRRLRRRQARERELLFVVEGEDLVAAGRAAGRTPRALLWAGEDAPGGDWLTAEPRLLRDVSELGSGARAIGIFEQRWGEPAGPLCVYLHAVRDPGNVGTIIRAAQAFGAGSVVLGPDCADPHGPKATRASMGAIFAVVLARTGTPEGLPGELVGLDAGASETLQGPPFGPLTLVVGGERSGLPAQLRRRCDRLCAIPQAAGDSLNAAMAATVALYEMTRVRPT
ncbi:MAG: RNA methyltransferase [Solirubrobacteraceae bacterium]